MSSLWRTTLVLLILSTIIYAMNGTLEYILLKHFSLYSFFFLWSLGGVLSVPLLMRMMGMRNDLFRNVRRHILSITGGVLLVVFNLALFMAFKLYFLAGVYPLIAVSSLMFFAIDLARYRSRLRSTAVVLTMAGIILVVVGTFFAESIGFSFNYFMLPFALVIILFAGLGYYLVFYNIHKYSIGSKISAIALASFVSSIFLLFAAPQAETMQLAQPFYSVVAVISGMLYVAAVAIELKAVKINENIKLYKSVILKNFINNFTYLDTVLVLLFSVAIGSFVPVEVLGGLLIVFGIVIIAMAKGKGR